MSELVDMLRKFNRKERYWLLRNALGSKSEVLDEDFRSRLAKSVDFEIPKSAWWAMDYHFDWMVGALHMLSNGNLNEPEAKENELVTGSQEDIDLLIAFDKTLLFVEAKADTSWNTEQWDSK